MCLCTVSEKAHRTTGSCSGLSKRKQTHTHPHRASVCTWTQTEPVQNPPPLQNLHHCYPETCQTGHGTGTRRGYQDGGKRQEGVREGMTVRMACTRKDWGGDEKDISGIFLKVPRGQRWWDAGGLHAWSLLLVPLLFLKNSLVPFCLQLQLTVRALTDPTITISQRSSSPERCRLHLCLLNISETI